MKIDWPGVLPIVSAGIALGAMLFSFRSSQIARNSLKLAYRSSQAAYEATKVDPRSAVTMYITEVEYRRSDAQPHEVPNQNEDLTIMDLFDANLDGHLEQIDNLPEAGDFEVVVRGRLVNNVKHEILLTCNYSPPMFGAEDSSRVMFDRIENLVLPADGAGSFEVVLRRSKRAWARINKRCTRRDYLAATLDTAGMSRHRTFMARLDRELDYLLLARNKVERCEFWFVCEPRFTERVATVWKVQIRKNPVEATGYDELGRQIYSGLVGALRGPFNDSVVFYRGQLDSTLALLNPPKYPYGQADLPGQER